MKTPSRPMEPRTPPKGRKLTPQKPSPRSKLVKPLGKSPTKKTFGK